jgi:hypothetical protein
MSILDGIIEIELGGDVVQLRPTPHTALKLSQTFGGLVTLANRIEKLDFEAMVAVVMHGGGYKPNDAAKVSEKIFEAGIVMLSRSLIDFVTILATGGKPMVGLDDAEPESAGKD